MPPPNGVIRCRPRAPETKRCAVGQGVTMRCRSAPTPFLGGDPAKDLMVVHDPEDLADVKPDPLRVLVRSVRRAGLALEADRQPRQGTIGYRSRFRWRLRGCRGRAPRLGRAAEAAGELADVKSRDSRPDRARLAQDVDVVAFRGHAGPDLLPGITGPPRGKAARTPARRSPPSGPPARSRRSWKAGVLGLAEGVEAVAVVGLLAEPTPAARVVEAHGLDVDAE
jgi:hypothetical protein